MDYSFIFLWILALAALLALIATAALAFLLFMKQREVAREVSDIRIGMAEMSSHLDKPLGDLLGEERRMTRLISELLALKQAEMTGDFEIVEEPIEPAPAKTEPPRAKTRPVERSGSAAKLAPPPQSFPKIQ